MPFAPINVKEEIEKQRDINPEFRKAWDESRAEYKLIGEMIFFTETRRNYTKGIS